MVSTQQVAIAAFFVLTTPLAYAQDQDATPAFGSLSLSSGFSPDPRVVEIAADPGNISAPCGHSVRELPYVRVEYSGGGTLIVSAASSADTSLLITGPD